jgi:putative membrane protein
VAWDLGDDIRHEPEPLDWHGDASSYTAFDVVDLAHLLEAKMALLAAGVVVVVAMLHAYFLVLEMFLWQRDSTRKIFETSFEFARDSARMAANQGLYNGFLSAGLIWSLVAYGPRDGRAILGFFLACVIVAGVYGAATVNRKILFVQALPAAIAMVLVWLA